MIPTLTKDLIDDAQAKCEQFLFVNHDPERLVAQLAQLMFFSEVLLDYPELSREAGFIENLISAYEKKIHRIDPTYDF